MSDYEIEQYRQCYENYRQLWITFWRIPTVAVTISAGVIAVGFIYFWGNDKWFQFGVLLLAGHVLASALALVAYKFRFFGRVWQSTLTSMEQDIKPFKKRVKRSTFPEPDITTTKELWYDLSTNWLQSPSAELFLVVVLAFVSLLQLGLSVYGFGNHYSLQYIPVALAVWSVLLVIMLLMAGLRIRPRQDGTTGANSRSVDTQRLVADDSTGCESQDGSDFKALRYELKQIRALVKRSQGVTARQFVFGLGVIAMVVGMSWVGIDNDVLGLVLFFMGFVMCGLALVLSPRSHNHSS